MIGMLTGKIAHLTSEYCIIDTASGVGYQVFMPVSHLADLSQNASVRVWVHTAVREDAITLYGFLDEDNYRLFETLLTVKGVGARTALGILGSTQPENFILAVQNRDLHFLTQLPGIGKKGAERLLLELKDKFGKNMGDVQYTVSVSAAMPEGAVTEAVEALASLGYARAEIMPVLKKIKDVEKLSGEEILRQALKLFVRR